MPPLSDQQIARVKALAKAQGWDVNQALKDAADLADEEAQAGGADQADAPKERAPGKNDAASEGEQGAPTGAESGAKAHGGRGYFAYEYPFLRVNQVLESLFLPPIEDGNLFTGEWLKKHSGGAPAPAEPKDEESK